MRKQVGHKYQVDWDGLVHATITGFGSAACIYLNIYAAVHMTGMPGTCFLPFSSVLIFFVPRLLKNHQL
jgi:hypothetical protein